MSPCAQTLRPKGAHCRPGPPVDASVTLRMPPEGRVAPQSSEQAGRRALVLCAVPHVSATLVLKQGDAG